MLGISSFPVIVIPHVASPKPARSLLLRGLMVKHDEGPLCRLRHHGQLAPTVRYLRQAVVCDEGCDNFTATAATAAQGQQRIGTIACLAVRNGGGPVLPRRPPHEVGSLVRERLAVADHGIGRRSPGGRVVRRGRGCVKYRLLLAGWIGHRLVMGILPWACVDVGESLICGLR